MFRKRLLPAVLGVLLSPQLLWSQSESTSEQTPSASANASAEQEAIQQAQQAIAEIQSLFQAHENSDKNNLEQPPADDQRDPLRSIKERENATKSILALQNQAAAQVVEREFMDSARKEQRQVLERELHELSRQREILQQSEEAIFVAQDAVQAMAQRLAEAQIDNRLRHLEAAALVEVLKSEGKKQLANNREIVNQAVVLLERRQAELARSPESEDQEREYKHAAQLYQAATEREIQAEAVLNDRLAEASIELAVSQLVEQSLNDEMARIRKQLQMGSEAGRIEAQYARLQDEVMELRLAASREQSEAQMRRWNETAKMEQEVLIPLQVRARVLTEQLGEGHPAVKAMQTQIKALQKQLEELRRAAADPGH